MHAILSGPCRPCRAFVAVLNNFFCVVLDLQDTGGFFIAVLEKVAPTPPLEDPKMGHRYAPKTHASSVGLQSSCARNSCTECCITESATRTVLQVCLGYACDKRMSCFLGPEGQQPEMSVCRFANYVVSSSKPNRIVKLDGQEPFQGAANAAEAALQVSRCPCSCLWQAEWHSASSMSVEQVQAVAMQVRTVHASPVHMQFTSC